MAKDFKKSKEYKLAMKQREEYIAKREKEEKEKKEFLGKKILDLTVSEFHSAIDIYFKNTREKGDTELFELIRWNEEVNY
jgi:hypothetical protein